MSNPVAFALQVLKAFQANQGLLLAGAVAYYALLSIVPLLILMVIALSHVIEQDVLLATLGRALEYVVPGEGRAVVVELKAFLDHREVIGWVLLVTMLFFSSLGFRVLESAISVIFLHRVADAQAAFLVSLLLPFGYIVFIGAVLFAGHVRDRRSAGDGRRESVLLWAQLVAERLLALADLRCRRGRGDTADFRNLLFHAGRQASAHHALIGGVTAGLLWEIIRHALGWYFGTLSQVAVVYGSLTTAIVVLLSLELAATLLLLGAQVIAEYERIDTAMRPRSRRCRCALKAVDSAAIGGGGNLTPKPGGLWRVAPGGH